MSASANRPKRPSFSSQDAQPFTLCERVQRARSSVFPRGFFLIFAVSTAPPTGTVGRRAMHRWQRAIELSFIQPAHERAHRAPGAPHFAVGERTADETLNSKEACSHMPFHSNGEESNLQILRPILNSDVNKSRE